MNTGSRPGVQITYGVYKLVRPYDFSRLRKTITKNIDGLSIGFHDPIDWINTGNYALNYGISKRFDRGIPLGQVTMIAGESGAGKSLLSANIMRNAQSNGILVVAFDTENGLTEEWLSNTGVDPSEDKFLRVQVGLIDNLAKTLSDFIKDYKDQMKEVDIENRTKILFVVDSLGALLSSAEIKQFQDGNMKGDMGIKAKALNSLIKNCLIDFAEFGIGMVCTNHTYSSQNIFAPDDVISGGQGFTYGSSIVIAIKKGKLRGDENDKKNITGIRAMTRVIKSRYSKPFESVEIDIPYESGIDPYSGLVDLFEKKEVLVKDGKKLKYTDADGKDIKEWRKDIGPPILDKIMSEWKEQEKITNEDKEHENNDEDNGGDEE